MVWPLWFVESYFIFTLKFRVAYYVFSISAMPNVKWMHLILPTNHHVSPHNKVSCPYLGVHVDPHLKWDGHILNLCKKISQKLAVLCRLRKVLSKRMLCQQYLLCIQPCIDYAISVWGSCSKQNKAVISQLQHRAARIVNENFYFINVRGTDLLKELGWQSLNLRRNYYTTTPMYKCINEVGPIRLINEVHNPKPEHFSTIAGRILVVIIAALVWDGNLHTATAHSWRW